MLKIGIIGLGIISRNHANAITQNSHIKLVAGADINDEKRQQFKSEYGISTYDDYKQMLECENLDAVVIALPHGLHAEVTTHCAAAKVHVLLEKPMANTTQECNEIIKAVEQNNIKFMLAHPQRYFAENIKAKELISSHILGEPVCITDLRNLNYFTDSRPSWFSSKALAGGGIVMNYGAHSLDKLTWITDSQITRITGKATQFIDGIEVDGNAQIFLEFESGITANITYCGYNVPPINDTTFYFTNGILKLGTEVGLWAAIGGGEFETVEITNRQDPFALMWDDFITAIQNDTISPIDAQYGLRIIELIEQIYSKN